MNCCQLFAGKDEIILSPIKRIEHMFAKSIVPLNSALIKNNKGWSATKSIILALHGELECQIELFDVL